MSAREPVTWTEQARKDVQDRHGCEKVADYRLSEGRRTVYYCGRHHVGWLHDVDGCAHVDAALTALAPHVEQAIREARAEALREAADEMRRVWMQERTTLGMATDDWLRERADREAGR